MQQHTRKTRHFRGWALPFLGGGGARPRHSQDRSANVGAPSQECMKYGGGDNCNVYVIGECEKPEKSEFGVQGSLGVHA